MVFTQASSKHADDASVKSTKSAKSVKSVANPVKTTESQQEIFSNDQTQELQEIASAMAATVSVCDVGAAQQGRDETSMHSKKSKSVASKFSLKSTSSKKSVASMSMHKSRKNDATGPSKIEEEAAYIDGVVESEQVSHE